MKKNLTLFFCSLTVAWIISEMVILLMTPKLTLPKEGPLFEVLIPERVWTEYHPILGWFHQLNKKAILKKGDREVGVTINSEGFRGIREYKEEKSQSTLRIVSLGDSFAFGFGVSDDATFVAQLEAQYENVEMVNLGVCGYGIDQALLSFTTIGKKFHPDYVIVGVFPENFQRATHAFTDAGYGKPYFQLLPGDQLLLHNVPPRKPAELNYKQFPEVIRYGVVERVLMRTALYRYIKRKVVRLFRDLEWIDPDLTDEWRLGRVILRQLIAEIRASGAKVLVLLIPPDRWMSSTKPTSIQKSLHRFSDREQFDLLDLTPLFKKAVANARLEDFYLAGDGHWTQRGHALVAHAIANHLTNLGYTLKMRMSTT